MAEVTTYECDSLTGDGCEGCTNPATVTVDLGFPGRGAPHNEREVTLQLDLCDEHVTSWRGSYRLRVDEADEVEAEAITTGRNRRNRTCKRCGFGPTTSAGLAAHQRATGHKGSAPA